MLNDKNTFFPNLPHEIRSGFFVFDPTRTSDKRTLELLEEHQMYWIFSSDSVILYNFDLQKPITTEPLKKFLKCNENS